MAQLLLEEDLLASEEEGEAQKLARARTITAIADSDAEGNRSVTRFLAEMDLVIGTDPVRLLKGSHLPDAELSGAFLPAADLYVSSLRDADLSGAFLIKRQPRRFDPERRRPRGGQPQVRRPRPHRPRRG